MPKFVRNLLVLTLAVVFGTAFAAFVMLPDKPMIDPNTKQNAVKLHVPLDLTGEWKSETPNVIATVKDGTIDVQSVLEDGGYARWWYGTFDNPQDGKVGVTSKGIADDDKFYLSTEETKNFVYEKGMLKFQISVMGITKVIEMKRG